MTETELLTYLTDAAEPPPRLGEPLILRVRRGGADVEAYTPAGRRLGRVPPGECVALAKLLAGHDGMPGRVTALVPRPGLAGAGRVHVTLFAA